MTRTALIVLMGLVLCFTLFGCGGGSGSGETAERNEYKGEPIQSPTKNLSLSTNDSAEKPEDDGQ